MKNRIFKAFVVAASLCLINISGAIADECQPCPANCQRGGMIKAECSKYLHSEKKCCNSAKRQEEIAKTNKEDETARARLADDANASEKESSTGSKELEAK